MKSLPLKFLGLICLLTLIGTMLFQSRSAQFQPGTAQDSRDLVFATVGSQELRLALFIPESAKNPPLVVYIHQGGWTQGSYKSCPICWLTQEGFAVASVSYRFSDVAKFPAQIHDVKAAVRWLRAHAPDYGYYMRLLQDLWPRRCAMCLDVVWVGKLPRQENIVALCGDLLCFPHGLLDVIDLGQ